MERDPRALIWDVRNSADAILRFTAGQSELDYHSSDMLRSAVERHFEIIGEALRRLLKARPDLAAKLPDIHQAIALRNVLIHGYAGVDDATVWQAVQVDLPRLRDASDRLLAEQ